MRYSKKFSDRLKSIWLCQTEPTEFFAALITLAWGLWIQLPTESFVFQVQYWWLSILGEHTIGFIAIALGVLALVALFSNSRPLRLASSFAQFCFWVFLTAMLVMTAWQLPVVSYSLLMIVKCAWITIRLK